MRFTLVFRTADHRNTIPNPNQDRWGWESVDGCEYTDYATVQAMLQEYRAAMPMYHVAIRARKE